ncbi:extracellular solute-binding protein [Mesorhizobium waimense]|uniref:Extracellular solute-binding protein n=1 Tax=Mesorhizobium waimense TaxID=1300307 RepID=A0A3A5KHL0_9HYPH|nr:extracellular solute-binding protein [Mesorhizobium waimense]RJT32020.1 extracellular solute-binding protein [Mesorhizobium waimense]
MSRRGFCFAAVASGAAISVVAKAIAADNSAAVTSQGEVDSLVAAAQAEGQLTVIGLPRDWCNYGAVIDGFKAKYGLTVHEVQPYIGSDKQIEALKAARSRMGPAMPDFIDVGMAFAASAKQDGLLMPYRAQSSQAVPENAKDAQGYWSCSYYGVLAFEVNANLIRKIPLDWAELAAPEYRNSVALAGDLASNQAIMSVFAAGLSAANGTSEKAAEHGLSFFADLVRKGNFVPEVGDAKSLVDGRTPIILRWDHLALADRDRLKGTTAIEVVRPRTGVLAGMYAQAISAFAPHPNAARLWMEYLGSDEVQLMWFGSHCRPTRIAGLLYDRNGPSAGRDSPLSAEPDEPVFPTLEEQEKARATITKGWDDIVGVKVKCAPPEQDLSPMSLNQAQHSNT